jgi:hypothetical protein
METAGKGNHCRSRADAVRRAADLGLLVGAR